MEHEQQVKIVAQALALERKAENANRKYERLYAERNPEHPPAEPQKQSVTRQIPIIRSKIKVDWLTLLLPAGISGVLFILAVVGRSAVFSVIASLISTFAFFGWPIVYYFVIYKKKKQEEEERIRNSAEYRQQCAAAEARFESQSKQAESEYQKAMAEYKTVLFPEYCKRRDAWLKQHQQSIDRTLAEYRELRAKLDALYNATKIIPAQYRTIPALEYICNMMSTSEYNIRDAIDNYDRCMQRRIDEAKLYEQQKANVLADAQNALLDEQNYIAKKQRRDENIAAIIGTVQRHKLYKTIKNSGSSGSSDSSGNVNKK